MQNDAIGAGGRAIPQANGARASVAEDGEAVPAFPNNPGERGEAGEREGAVEPAAGVDEGVEAAKVRFAEGAMEARVGGLLAAVLLAAVLGMAAAGATAVGEVLPPEMQGAQHEGE